ncbi:MAG TPA: hypothetical protein PKL57_05770 [Candidatus Wallbacteria bacterium]|nr:hypothetical protein [Candidatus Wallbacteria bacterium]
MKINLRGAAVCTALFILVLSFAVCGCGGGGSSSPIFFDNPQNISVKLNMLDRTPSQAYVSIPQNALGTVNISVISIKDKKEVANKTVDYSLNVFTFDNQIPAGDTYSVIVTARLKERANDIYESIWQGSGTVTVLNAEKALKTPGANEVSVSLVFRTIEYIKLYPTKIVFEPALPVGEITPSTIIPSFKLSVLDQFGNTMTSENGLISVSLENGSFKDSINSKNLANGSAVFSNLAVSSLIPDQAGYIKLKAVYGSLTAYSQPIKSSGAVIPDSLLAGYLTDDSAAAPGMKKSYAPLAGKEIKVICGNLQYFTVTDSSGFFKLDLKAGPSEVPVYIEFLTSSGSAVRLQTFIKGAKVKLANIRIGPGGEPRLITSELAASYDSKLDA